MKTLEELKEEATELGIEFASNIGAKTLQAKIEAKYEELGTDATEEIDEVEPTETEVKKTKADSKKSAMAIIKEQERKNKETIVVKIQMVDKRESSHATSAYFGSGSMGMRVPLDEFVEMPRLLVTQAEEARALIHVERNGAMEPKFQKKYVVEYKNGR